MRVTFSAVARSGEVLPTGAVALIVPSRILAFIDPTPPIRPTLVVAFSLMRESADDSRATTVRVQLVDVRDDRVVGSAAEEHVTMDDGYGFPHAAITGIFPIDAQLPGLGAYRCEIALDGHVVDHIPIEAVLARNHVLIASGAVLQDRQGEDQGERYLVGRVTFTVVTNAGRREGLVATLKQTSGDDFRTAPLEVSLPSEVRRYGARQDVREFFEQVYRESIGSMLRGMENATGLTMEDNIVAGQARVLEFRDDTGDLDNAAW